MPEETASVRVTLMRVGLASTLVCVLATGALAQGTEGVRGKPQLQAQGARRTPGRLIIPVTGTVGSSAVPSTPAEPATPSTPPTTPSTPPATPEVPPALPSEPPATPPTGTPTEPTTPTSPGGVDTGVVPDLLGSFSIQRFAQTTEGGLAAVGTLTVSFVDPASSLARTIVTQVAMPVTRAGDARPSASGAGSQSSVVTPSAPGSVTSQASASASGQACETLSLTLEPIQMNLLGVPVQLDQVNVDFTVVPGTSARLGVLLCGVTGLMDSGVNPAERTNILNSLLDTIG